MRTKCLFYFGTEKVFRVLNPWQIFAVQQRKKLSLFFNRSQFTACQEIICDALGQCKSDSSEEELFKGLKLAVDGYLEWDRFEHKKARDILSEANKSLTLYARLTGNMEIKDFVASLDANLEYLNRFSQDTRGYNYEVLSRWHVLDLLANAERRYDDGRFDDAVARVYRALEMAAQWKLVSTYKIKTSEVSPESIPEEIREDFVQKYSNGEFLQLPLAASFRLLHVLGDDMGKKYVELKSEMEKILYTRNYSILAHGVQPVGANPYRNFMEYVMVICNIDKSEMQVFPELYIDYCWLY